MDGVSLASYPGYTLNPFTPGVISRMRRYTMRTDRYRYTEWVRWNGSALAPIWSDMRARELYDHQVMCFVCVCVCVWGGVM